MIHPAPTGRLDPTLARGVFEGEVPASATKPGYVVVSFPNTSYQIHLVPEGQVSVEPGKRIVGTISVRARRMDRVASGGRYVEPVYGRPRRVQGRVVAVSDGKVCVNAGVPIHCSPTDARQRPEDFRVGELVSMDVLDGASFRQA